MKGLYFGKARVAQSAPASYAQGSQRYNVSKAKRRGKTGNTALGLSKEISPQVVQATPSSSNSDKDQTDPEDLSSWQKRAFSSKPKEPGSTRTPRQGDYIDAEWQELQQRAKMSGAQPDPASASGRLDAKKIDGLSVEDSWDLADDYTPFPGPGGAGSPSDAVMADQWPIGSNYNMATSSELWNRVSQVYVILFGVGKSETEGIYSLRAVTGSDGLPVDTIIAFESGEDAQRYAGLLEAAMSRHVPEVSAIESKDLLDFCADSGYNCRLEPAGTLLMPPEYNVGMTDWERSLRLREGIFNVLPEDPSLQDSEENSLSDLGKVPVTQYSGPTLMNSAGAYFPTDIQGLEELKARLEKLLPSD